MQVDWRDYRVDIEAPGALPPEDRAALLPDLNRRGIAPAMLDIMMNIPNRTRIVKVRGKDGTLVGLTNILLTPHQFMKHVFGEGNHIGTNTTFFFAGQDRRAEILTAVFRKLTATRRFGFMVGLMDPDFADDFACALRCVPHFSGWKILEAGSITTDGPDVRERLLHEHSHLPKQVKRFRNKGGSIHIHEGAASGELADQFMVCCRDSYKRHRHPGGSIDIDLYAGLVRDFVTSFDGAVHVYAKFGDQVVGVQTFVRHLRHLELTEGGFAEAAKTYHAYENIVLESARFAAERGLSRVSYGLISNPAKDRLMDTKTRLPIVAVALFRSWLMAALAWPYRFRMHRRFPLPYWRDRSRFPQLTV
jgi:hypothetical protein